jgi:hypothetical protein
VRAEHLRPFCVEQRDIGAAGNGNGLQNWSWLAVIGLTLPFGVAMAGQTVFMTMQCYSCHGSNIPGETLPADAGGIGPDLTPGCATLPQEYLAEPIIKANAVVAAPGDVVKEEHDLLEQRLRREAWRGGRHDADASDRRAD